MKRFRKSLDVVVVAVVAVAVVVVVGVLFSRLAKRHGKLEFDLILCNFKCCFYFNLLLLLFFFFWKMFGRSFALFLADSIIKQALTEFISLLDTIKTYITMSGNACST